jgi:flavin prenyltransferase
MNMNVNIEGVMTAESDIVSGNPLKILVAISGASGAIYGVRLFQKLQESGHRVEFIITEYGGEVLRMESNIDPEKLKELADAVYSDGDLGAAPSSGSYRYDAMVICPCSMSTLSKIAAGISDTLITRAAAVCLKERRKLIIVPRETPLSTIYLRNMLTLSESGAVILPPSPGFYHQPESIREMIDFVVGKIMDSLDIDHTLFKRWGE